LRFALAGWPKRRIAFPVVSARHNQATSESA
jgi:hypothetical protein